MLSACLKLPFDFLTTEQVRDELLLGVEEGLPHVPLDGITVRAVSRPLDPGMLSELDAGEVSVIQLAIELGAEWTCIDETDGRAYAKSAGLRVTGAVGLLLRAKHAGLIGAVRPVLAAMLASGVRLSDRLLVAALQDAGEWNET